MRIDSVSTLPDGSCSVGVHNAPTADLFKAFDPYEPFIVIEAHSPGGSDWQELDVPLAPGPASMSTHRVRRMRFDLLLTPAEALAVASALDVPFPNGGLFAWQMPTEPPPTLSLLDRDHQATVSAMIGIGVTLKIDQPHARETAVLWSPTRILLDRALARLSK